MSTVRDFPSVLLGCAQLPNERNTLGGIVSGVPTGTSVVLANGREDLPLTADGGFTFTTPLAAGSAYAVTVKTSLRALAAWCAMARAQSAPPLWTQLRCGVRSWDPWQLACGSRTSASPARTALA